MPLDQPYSVRITVAIEVPVRATSPSKANDEAEQLIRNILTSSDADIFYIDVLSSASYLMSELKRRGVS